MFLYLWKYQIAQFSNFAVLLKIKSVLRTVPTIVTANIFCTWEGSLARRERNAQDARTGFVSCKSGRFELFLVEKMRRFSTEEK